MGDNWIGLVAAGFVGATLATLVLSWFAATRDEDTEARELRIELRDALAKHAQLHEALDRAKRANLHAIATGMEIARPLSPTWPEYDAYPKPKRKYS